ncbi:hydrogenase iron-sulfur subunit [Archaeoglobus fulgidus]|uniref:Methylviologen-reducing hydrogenase, subunit delta (VhuD) n=2 Tax=Archaeoglobus fulgidus TaxID=2234 RepID=O28897_ARCFU|nr:hydrogenase iron-sulfur subunit [Archaeoglobus fulgidus]AAB89870.1 methylviologen-reducing hydrogenase, subunit delta (vhuD) [Archaeoglobus fulgidus DSM 4304]AIG98253.1 Coenzyme F420-reducing hydrogenase, delta subunit [Archaeoglobus fulgidus DSM 8774]
MKIIGFACQWCAYQAADLAGSLKMKYPESIRLLRVPCSGRVNAEFILKALLSGADGVFVAGCPISECHYRSGNRIAKTKVALLKRLLPEFGLESGRVEFLQVSSADARKFVEFAKEFDERIRKLGPNPLRRDER